MEGQSGSPCLRPLEAGKKPLGDPLRIIEKWVEERQPKIQDLHLAPNTFFAKINLGNSNLFLSRLFLDPT